MIKIVPIKLRRLPFDEEQQKRVINNFLEMAALNIKIDFDVTTQTWRGRPDFVIKRDPTKFERTISTVNRIYYFVSGGTRVRYATMTMGFRAKTVVMAIRSRKGKGGVAFISRKFPRPGIKARDFPIAIVKKQSKFFKRMFTTAVASEANNGQVVH